ncbi:MAG: FlgD immunoglobulin-like domain containing protein, partial [Elusimicrobiota bacterium]
ADKVKLLGGSGSGPIFITQFLAINNQNITIENIDLLAQVRFTNCSNVSLRQNIFEPCPAFTVGDVHFGNSQGYFLNNLVTPGNSVFFYCAGAGPVNIINNTILGNIVGMAISCDYNCRLNIVYKSRYSGKGYGIYNESTNNKISYCLLYENDNNFKTRPLAKLFLGEEDRPIINGIQTMADVDCFTVENCIFYHTQSHGIYNKNRTRTQAGWRVVNNTFYHCGDGVRISEHDVGSPGDDLVFANNLIVSPLSGYALHAGNSKAGFTIDVRNCGFYGITGGLVKYAGSGNTYNYADTLMERNPDFVLTDSMQWNNGNFMKPWLDTVLEGGLVSVVPGKDFHLMSSGDAWIGAVCMGEKGFMAKRQAGPEVVQRLVRYPKVFALHDATPNPFNPFTVIRYDIPADVLCDGKYDMKSRYTTLKVYDIHGRLVKTLEQGGKVPGYYSVTWDGRNNHGKQMGSSIYIYQIISDMFVKTKKMTLLK